MSVNSLAFTTTDFECRYVSYQPSIIGGMLADKLQQSEKIISGNCLYRLTDTCTGKNL